MPLTEPIVCITNKCNKDCIFCSIIGTNRDHPDSRIKATIDKFRDTISIEGGEPMLSPRLVNWVSYASRMGVRDIIVCTNGARCSNSAFVTQLINAGVTMFNVNFQAHDPRLFDRITRTKRGFKRNVESIKNLIAVAGGSRVRITLVVHSMVSRFLPGYAKFVIREFPGIFYIGFNLAKVLGHVVRRKRLVPRLAETAPYLKKAMSMLKEANIRFISDGFPLCFLEGFESDAIDTYKMVHGADVFMGEKTLTPACRNCTLKKICGGVRKDYFKIYGDKEISPSGKNPGPIIKAILKRDSSFAGKLPLSP